MYKQYILVWKYEYYKDFSWKTEGNTSDPHVKLQNNTETYVFQLLQVHVHKIHVHKDFTSVVSNISPKVAISTYNTTDHHWDLDSSGYKSNGKLCI